MFLRREVGFYTHYIKIIISSYAWLWFLRLRDIHATVFHTSSKITQGGAARKPIPSGIFLGLFTLNLASNCVYSYIQNMFKIHRQIGPPVIAVYQTSQPEMRFCSKTSSKVAWKLQLGSNQ